MEQGCSKRQVGQLDDIRTAGLLEGAGRDVEEEASKVAEDARGNWCLSYSCRCSVLNLHLCLKHCLSSSSLPSLRFDVLMCPKPSHLLAARASVLPASLTKLEARLEELEFTDKR